MTKNDQQLDGFAFHGNSGSDYAHKKYLVERFLKIYLSEKDDSVLKQAVAYSLEGAGKKIRPVLCLAVAESYDYSLEKALPIACAIEMIHTMSLIHDDLPCIDDAALRRGRACTHIEYGEDIGLLAGDLMLTAAFQMIAEIKDIPAALVLKVLQCLTNYLSWDGLAQGQSMDVQQDSSATSHIEHLIDKKTGVLFSAALTCGAIPAGVDQGIIEELHLCGMYLGRIYQIVDDILDASMTTSKLMKDCCQDERHNKATYVSIVGLENTVDYINKLGDKTRQACIKADGPLVTIDYIVARLMASIEGCERHPSSHVVDEQRVVSKDMHTLVS